MNTKARVSLVVFAIALMGPFSGAQLQPRAICVNGKQSIQIKLPYSSSASCETRIAQDSALRYANRGDIATGVVVDTPGRELHLNIRPCEAEPMIVVFREPYERSTRGQKSCRGGEVNIEQIQQR